MAMYSIPMNMPMQIMQGEVMVTTAISPSYLDDLSGTPGGQSKPSKYARYGTDLESLRNASQALPYVYKFFWMIYRLSPVRTIIIIAVFLIQGFLPALRLRTGGDFIRQVCRGEWSLLIGSCKKEYSRGPSTPGLYYVWRLPKPLHMCLSRVHRLFCKFSSASPLIVDGIWKIGHNMD